MAKEDRIGSRRRRKLEDWRERRARGRNGDGVGGTGLKFRRFVVSTGVSGFRTFEH